jgi:hypothetical protein
MRNMVEVSIMRNMVEVSIMRNMVEVSIPGLLVNLTSFEITEYSGRGFK